MAEKETFQKRSGTTDRGKDYEDCVIAKLILELVTDENITNFKLSSNDKNFGAFDDIVVETESNKQKKLYAFQLKHGNKEDKCLPLNSLKANSGNFAIKKYFNSFKTIKTHAPCTFILFTNLKFDAQNDTQIRLVDEENVTVAIKRRDSTEQPFNDGVCYTFEIANSKISSSEFKQFEQYQTFFKNFVLYTDQPNVEKTKEIVASKIQQNFHCSYAECASFLHFISQWSIREGIKEKLNKDFMQRIIALTMLTPVIRPLYFGPVNDKMKLLQEAITRFDITFFRDEEYEAVKGIWGDAKEELPGKDDEINKIVKKYQLNFTKDTGYSELLWLMGKSPLIVKEHETVYKVINLCQQQNFVILTSATPENRLQGSIFRNLSDLKTHSELYKNILSTFKCLMQGKEISLEFLIESNEISKSLITTNELVKMLECPYGIGEKKEEIPEPYISRTISLNLVDISYFQNINKTTLVVLDRVNIDKIKNKIGNFNLIEAERFLRETDTKNPTSFDENCRPLYHTSPILEKFVSGPNIYISENECTGAVFKKICERNPNVQNFHHFRVLDKTTLEWIQSRGDVGKLEQYRKENNNMFIAETHLYNKQPENNINLINGDPGMGKSQLLKNIKNHSSPKSWAVFLSSKDITTLCAHLEETAHKEDEFIKFIINSKYGRYPIFDKKVIKSFIRNHQVVYFWDALDEITTKNTDIITSFIQELSLKSSSQWITSRSHLKNQLEKKFNVLSRNISQFNEEEQTLYIRKRLYDLYSDDDIGDIVQKIRSTVTMIRHNDVLGVPLQIFMLTELFRQDHQKYLQLLKKVFPLTDLYQHIINAKFNRYYEEKANVFSPNEALRQVLEDHKKSMFEKYEKAGLKALITKEVFKHLNINCDDFLNEIQNRADSIGLITEVTDNFPQFLHNSYAEFFVAKYFTEHYKEINNFDKIIFDTRHANIRFFFDLLTAKDSSAHIAVLYKNIDLLKQNKSNLNITEDSEGRSALQLACSWGQKYPLLDIRRDNEIYIVNNDNDNLFEGEKSEYMEMLHYLLESCQSEDSSQERSLAYAEKADCLVAKLKILSKNNRKLFKLKLDNEGISLLYYSTKFGYEEVINLFEKVPFVKTTRENASLLHLAVSCNNEKYLKRLLSVEVYQTSINDKDKYGHTPLYKACENGRYNLAELLLQHGTDINSSANNGCTPLHTACLHNRVKIVQLLLKSEVNKVNINIVKDFKITPLHEACWNGHDAVAYLLLQHGAKVNIPAAGGCTPIYVASRNNHDKIVKLLLDFEADVNISQNDGVTPLFIACQEGHEKNVELLLSSNASVNITTKSGESPLYIACQNGHTSVVKMLIKSGADVKCEAKNGWTPLQIACQQGHLDVLRLLMEAVVNTEVVSKSINVARHHGHLHIVSLLQDFLEFS